MKYIGLKLNEMKFLYNLLTQKIGLKLQNCSDLLDLKNLQKKLEMKADYKDVENYVKKAPNNPKYKLHLARYYRVWYKPEESIYKRTNYSCKKILACTGTEAKSIY